MILNLFFNMSTKALKEGVDYIQLPGTEPKDFNSYALEEFDFTTHVGEERTYEKIILTIADVRNEAALQSFLAQMPLKCEMLAINFFDNVELTQLIRNLQPKKLTLTFPLKGKNKLRFPLVGRCNIPKKDWIEEVEVLTEYCMPVCNMNRVNGVKRLIIRPRFYPSSEHERYFQWIRGLLMNSSHIEHFVLELRHPLVQCLNKPENINLMLNFCYRDDITDDPEYSEIAVGEKVTMKSEITIENQGTLALIRQTPSALGETRAFLHFMPNFYDQIPWTLLEIPRYSEGIYSFQ